MKILDDFIGSFLPNAAEPQSQNPKHQFSSKLHLPNPQAKTSVVRIRTWNLGFVCYLMFGNWNSLRAEDSDRRLETR
jgi:hypothetical protein